MPNMLLNKVKMPEQGTNTRNMNFSEVALGYTDEMAKEEAQRCVQCKTRPCVEWYPVNVQIFLFMLTIIMEILYFYIFHENFVYETNEQRITGIKF